MVIGKPCGLVLPPSTQWLIDDIIGKGKVEWLMPLVAHCRGRHADSRHYLLWPNAVGFPRPGSA